MWTKEAVVSLTKDPRVRLGLSVVGAFSAGVGSSYLVLNKTLKAKYEAIANEEILEARKRSGVIRKEADPAEMRESVIEDEFEELRDGMGYGAPERTEVTLQEIIEKGVEEMTEGIVEEIEGRVVEVDVETEVEIKTQDDVVENIFEKAKIVDNGFDYDEEIKNRSDAYPYIITQDEFMNNESEYTQVSLTYFAGDDVLIDERDDVIDDTDNTVGDENLKKFGHGSQDNKIVYIRNDRVELEFEIIRSSGTFAKEVFGVVEHSDDDKRVRKFRSWHE